MNISPDLKKWLRYAVIALFIGYYAYSEFQNSATVTQREYGNNRTLISAIADKKSDVQVVAEGTVLKILPDDTYGSRHQRFLVRLPSDEVVLIAHNIDLAPYVRGLSNGDAVRFAGEFEWNEKGGVVHWTHHDPA
ncbi:MAG: DUF3465 domain-containing protein, partial [Pseudomonadota bacterium]